jgi:hypothetical protein
MLSPATHGVYAIAATPFHPDGVDEKSSTG